MNRLGIMVDISHVSDNAFYDVLDTTKVPVIASHSFAIEPLPGILLETHYRTSECEDMETIKGPEPIIAVLSDVARLYALPCTSSSHDDVTYRVYLFETGEIGGITRVDHLRDIKNSTEVLQALFNAFIAFRISGKT